MIFILAYDSVQAANCAMRLELPRKKWRFMAGSHSIMGLRGEVVVLFGTPERRQDYAPLMARIMASEMHVLRFEDPRDNGTEQWSLSGPPEAFSALMLSALHL